MMKPSDIVTGLIALNDGEIIGKTRLQKTFFLLDACGLGSGFKYDYHRFGPYSEELSEAVESAILSEKISCEEREGYHAVPYSRFHTRNSPPSSMGKMSKDEIISRLSIIGNYSALELEIAATIVYLWQSGCGNEALDEVKRLKPVKASPERIKEAIALLSQLQITAKHIAAA